MRTLLLVAVLGLGALLALPDSANAQFYPQFPFGGVRPVPFAIRSYGYQNGQFYIINRFGWAYPGSGYNWGYTNIYQPNYGVATGYFRGYTNPVSPTFGGYQFYPSYYSPGYFFSYPTTSPAGDRAPVYAMPSYYTPTY
jgi:hypothetical protein